jgi:hypothetical protein
MSKDSASRMNGSEVVRRSSSSLATWPTARRRGAPNSTNSLQRVHGSRLGPSGRRGSRFRVSMLQFHPVDFRAMARPQLGREPPPRATDVDVRLSTAGGACEPIYPWYAISKQRSAAPRSSSCRRHSAASRPLPDLTRQSDVPALTPGARSPGEALPSRAGVPGGSRTERGVWPVEDRVCKPHEHLGCTRPDRRRVSGRPGAPRVAGPRHIRHGGDRERSGSPPYSALISSTYARRPDGWKLAPPPADSTVIHVLMSVTAAVRCVGAGR